MNIFHITISALIFGSTLMLGTTAVVASRFVITTVTNFTKPSPESAVIPASESENVPAFEDLRKETPSNAEGFDPTGSYSLVMENVPAAFEDIERIEITTREFDDSNKVYGDYMTRPIIPTGSLQANKRFEFNKLSFGNREISFETVTRDGISYRFVGYFPVSTEKIICEKCKIPADLKGQLRKLENGKVIAEIEPKFYFTGAKETVARLKILNP